MSTSQHTFFECGHVLDQRDVIIKALNADNTIPVYFQRGICTKHDDCRVITHDEILALSLQLSLQKDLLYGAMDKTVRQYMPRLDSITVSYPRPLHELAEMRARLNNAYDVHPFLQPLVGLQEAIHRIDYVRANTREWREDRSSTSIYPLIPGFSDALDLMLELREYAGVLEAQLEASESESGDEAATGQVRIASAFSALDGIERNSVECDRAKGVQDHSQGNSNAIVDEKREQADTPWKDRKSVKLAPISAITPGGRSRYFTARAEPATDNTTIAYTPYEGQYTGLTSLQRDIRANKWRNSYFGMSELMHMTCGCCPTMFDRMVKHFGESKRF